MAGHGLRGDQICEILSISRATLVRKQRECKALYDALRLGREIARARINKTAYDMAASGKCWQMTFRWLQYRDQANWRMPPDDISKTVHPALRAANGQPLTGRALVERLKKELAEYEASLPPELEEGDMIDADLTEEA